MSDGDQGPAKEESYGAVPLPVPPNHRAAALVQGIYDLFVAQGAWPVFADVDRHLHQRDEPNSEEVLLALPPGLVHGLAPASTYIADDTELSLTVAALAGCNGADGDVDLFLRSVQRAVELEAASLPRGGDVVMSAADLGQEIDLPAGGGDDLLIRVGHILKAEPWGWKTARTGKSWSFTLTRHVRRFEGVTSIEDYWPRAHPAPETAASFGEQTNPRPSIAKRVIHVGQVAGAITAIAAMLVLVGGMLRHIYGWLPFGHDESRTYDYIAVPPVMAAQYVYPTDGATSSADPLLAFGSRVDVLCAVQAETGNQIAWVKLSEGTYLSADDVAPSPDEHVRLDQLPICD